MKMLLVFLTMMSVFSSKIMPMQGLPEETLLHILSYVPQKDLRDAKLVCHTWNRMASDQSLWRAVTLKPSATNETVYAVTAACPQLQYVNFSCCSKITDKAIQVLAERCPQLQYVNLERCDLITDEGISSLAQHCEQLQDMSLKHCYQITEISVAELVQSCPRLKHLCIRNCSISEEEFDTFTENYPHINITN